MAKSPKTKTPFWGMIKYDILDDGCLNSVWTNTAQAGRHILLNEIAKKRTGQERNTLIGQYLSSWIDIGDEQVSGTLDITANGNVAFTLKWQVNGQIEFSGVGMQLGDHLIVTYWSGDTIPPAFV